MEQVIQSALIENQLSVLTVLLVFMTGLLTSLTPCVYPMLPITVAVIGAQASSPRQGALFSLVYVMGVALVYAGLGVLAASTGQLFGVVASHPVTLIVAACFFLTMAAWMMGYLSLPQWAATPVFNSGSKGLNVFIAGGVSGLVMAPCTSPVLGMLLMYVAAAGDRLWGALLMFVFAVGMSALLVLAGSFSGFISSLPQSGQWLKAPKWFLSGLMVLAALYLVYPIMPYLLFPIS